MVPNSQRMIFLIGVLLSFTCISCFPAENVVNEIKKSSSINEKTDEPNGALYRPPSKNQLGTKTEASRKFTIDVEGAAGNSESSSNRMSFGVERKSLGKETDSHRLRNEWREQLRQGMDEIEKKNPDNAKLIRESKIFDLVSAVISIIVELKVADYAQSIRWGIRDWKPIEKFVKDLLGDPKEFKLPNHRYFPWFPALVKTNKVSGIIEYVLAVDEMNGQLYTMMLKEIEKNTKVVRNLIANCREVYKHLNKDFPMNEEPEFETYYYIKKTRKYVEEIHPDESMKHNEFTNLETKIAERKANIEGILKTVLYPADFKEVNEEKVFEILDEIFNRKMALRSDQDRYLEIWESFLALILSDLRFTKKEELAQDVFGFDFDDLSNARKSSDFDKYALNLLQLELKLQRKILNKLINTEDKGVDTYLAFVMEIASNFQVHLVGQRDFLEILEDLLEYWNLASSQIQFV